MLSNGSSKPLQFVYNIVHLTQRPLESAAFLNTTLTLLTANMVHISGIIGALLAITGVRASPYDSLHVGSPHRKLRSRDLATHNCVDFGTGSPNGYVSLGQVCVDITATAITVTYPTLSGGNTYTGAHLYIGTTPPTKRAPGLFPYNSYCTASGTSASCTVPLAACVQIGCGTTLYIAAQADVSGPASGTGWGQGTCFDCNNCVQSNCAKYWSFPTECKCTVVTTYAPITCTVSGFHGSLHWDALS